MVPNPRRARGIQSLRVGSSTSEPFDDERTPAMNGTCLGPAQVLFVRHREAIEVDLVLAGPAAVEGRPLVPGSPVALSLAPPPEGRARRRMLQRLRAWADGALACDIAIDLDTGVAVLTIRCSGGTVHGELTDLDVLFANDLPESSA